MRAATKSIFSSSLMSIIGEFSRSINGKRISDLMPDKITLVKYSGSIPADSVVDTTDPGAGSGSDTDTTDPGSGSGSDSGSDSGSSGSGSGGSTGGGSDTGGEDYYE